MDLNDDFSMESAVNDLFGPVVHNDEGFYEEALEGYDDIKNNMEDDEVFFATEAISALKDSEGLVGIIGIKLASLEEYEDDFEFSEEAEAGGKMAAIKAKGAKLGAVIIEAIKRLGQAIANMVKRIAVFISKGAIPVQKLYYKQNNKEVSSKSIEKSDLKFNGVMPIKTISAFLANIGQLNDASHVIFEKYNTIANDLVNKYGDKPMNAKVFKEAIQTAAKDFAAESDNLKVENIPFKDTKAVVTASMYGSNFKSPSPISIGDFLTELGGFSVLASGDELKKFYKNATKINKTNKMILKSVSQYTKKEIAPEIHILTKALLKINQNQMSAVIIAFNIVIKLRAQMVTATKIALKGGKAPEEEK